MASKTSTAKSVRLPNELWAKLAWVADHKGERVNDFIKAAVAERLERYDVPDLRVGEDQTSLDFGGEA